MEGASDPCELHRPCVGRTSLNEALSIYPHNIVLISHCCLCNKSKCQICTHTIFSLLEPQMKWSSTAQQEQMTSLTGLGMLRIWPTDTAEVYLIWGKSDPNALTPWNFLRNTKWNIHSDYIYFAYRGKKKYNFTRKIFNIQKLIYVWRIPWIATSVKLCIELICNFKPSSMTVMLEQLLVFSTVKKSY